MLQESDRLLISFQHAANGKVTLWRMSAGALRSILHMGGLPEDIEMIYSVKFGDTPTATEWSMPEGTREEQAAALRSMLAAMVY